MKTSENIEIGFHLCKNPEKCHTVEKTSCGIFEKTSFFTDKMRGNFHKEHFVTYAVFDSDIAQKISILTHKEALLWLTEQTIIE